MSIGLNAYILQNVYQQSYDSILQEKISKPLQLDSTYLNLPHKLEPYVALGHQDDKLRPYDKNIDVWFAASSLKSNIMDMAKFLRLQFSALPDKKLSQAIAIVHHNYYCFFNNTSCEQLGWQAHLIAELENDALDDSYFKNFTKNDNPLFDNQKITSGDTLRNKAIFIDKTSSGYGMSGYMLYDPEHKIGVVVLLNRSLGDARIKLGHDILRWQLNSKQSL